jgi:hypothetical protein
MKKITVEKTTKVVMYQATDGTQFTTEEECRKYEESAKCVLLTRYKPLVLNSITENELFKGSGSEEYTYDVVKINNEQDVETIIHLYMLYHRSDCYRSKDDSIREKVTTAYKTRDILFIGRDACGDDLFSIDYTRDELINNINKYCNESN